MKLNVFIRKGVLVGWVLVGVTMIQSCGFIKNKFGGGGSDDSGVSNGELTATYRKGYKQSTPAGMVPIPSGSFIMGQTDEDIAATMSNFNKRVTIMAFFMDDTEITNHEYRQFVNALLTDSISVLGEDIIMKEYYPDTTVWKRDFSYTNGDPMVEYYFMHPAFDTYPVVGVSWVAANYFSKWRSNMYNDHRAKEGLMNSPEFKLPTEAEWEWAARGGRAGAKYPWGNPYAVNAKGCYLANFKPQRGNYDADGYPYTAPANAYNPNDYGLYNMAGNVAEWTLDAYADNAFALTWDMAPNHEDANEPRKVVKGGSWKDIAYFLQSGTRTYEFETERRAYIGFRNVMLNIEGHKGASRR
jgi:sulfatase modifying factor 1